MSFQSPPPFNYATPPNQNQIAQGRLSLSSSLAVPVSDILAATALYFLNFLGNLLALYDTTLGWTVRTFTTASASLTALAANEIDDVFAYFSGGATVLELLPWRNFGQAVTSATNATPIVVTAASHGLKSGDTVYVNGCGTMTEANGTWIANVLTTSTFELVGSVGAHALDAGTGFFQARCRRGEKAGAGYSGPVTAATTATPISVTSASHGLVTGDTITIAGMKVLTAGNASWTVTVVDANTFTLDSSVGSGTHTAGTGYWIATGASLPAGYTGLQDGVACQVCDPTRRYLGIVIADATGGESEDSLANRLVGNLYNKQARLAQKSNSTGHDYALAAFQQWNATAANQVKFALAEAGVIEAAIGSTLFTKKAASIAKVSVGLDHATAKDGPIVSDVAGNSVSYGTVAVINVPNGGAHSLKTIEAATTDGGTFSSYELNVRVVN